MFARLENELAILERHLHVLDAVGEYEPVGLVTLTNRLPYPKHKVRYSLRVLETEDLIDALPAGVVTTSSATAVRERIDRQLRDMIRTLEACRLDGAPSATTTAMSATID